MDDENIPESNITKDEYMTMLQWDDTDAAKANQEWIKKGKLLSLRGPMSQYIAIKKIKKCHQLYKNGDKSVILYAMHLCVLDNLPMPKWLSKAFLEAYRNILHFREKKWDDVFGMPFPKNTQLKAERKKWELCGNVYSRISQIKKENPDRAIDEYLFEEVGNEFGLSKTLTSEYYYYFRKYFIETIPSAILELLEPYKSPEN